MGERLTIIKGNTVIMIINLIRSRLLFITVFLSLSVSQTSSQHTFVVTTDEGFIDYANRIIVCRGTSDIEERTPVDNSLNIVEKNIKIAKAQARTQARSNLIELMKKVKWCTRVRRMNPPHSSPPIGLP